MLLCLHAALENKLKPDVGLRWLRLLELLLSAKDYRLTRKRFKRMMG